MSAAIAIRVAGLRKGYGGQPAVAGVDLQVHRGECFALLGPNGAGKTTTVEILEGYRSRDGGQVEVLGVDPARAGSAWRARIGIVLQQVNDVSELTVREVVRHLATYYPNPRHPEEVIEMVGLSAKRNARTRELSGGQRRRLDVALGILGNPELLFLDEPTTGFDPEARRQFWELIEALSAGGTTILLTTHYLEEAERLADRVGVIVRGALVAVDTPAQLGGRSAAGATVRWQGPDGPQEVPTAEPARLVHELFTRHGELPGLTVARPTLEDAYLAMIGASEPAAPGRAGAGAAGSAAREPTAERSLAARNERGAQRSAEASKIEHSEPTAERSLAARNERGAQRSAEASSRQHREPTAERSLAARNERGAQRSAEASK
jgi:ABC-2 type transport system ATP-binding protein